MRKKSTDELLSDLMTQANFDAYLSGSQSSFSSTNDLIALLTVLQKKCSTPKAVLARNAGMSEVYLYQVLSGRRRPSRDRLLCLCIGMGATLEETQNILKHAVYAQLYLKHRRDAIISYGIVHHVGLSAINDKLFDENEKTLS